MTQTEIEKKRYLLDVITAGVGFLGFIAAVGLIITK